VVAAIATIAGCYSNRSIIAKQRVGLPHSTTLKVDYLKKHALTFNKTTKML